MNSEQKKLKIEELQTQLRLATDNFIKNYLSEFKSIAEVLNPFASFQVVGLAGVPSEIQSLVHEKIVNVDFLNTKKFFTLEELKRIEFTLNNLLKRLPLVPPFGYVLPFSSIPVPEEKDDSPLSYCLEHLKITDEEIFIYFLRYSPIFKINLFELRHVPQCKLFSAWNDSVLVFPREEKWVLVRDEEAKWYGYAR